MLTASPAYRKGSQRPDSALIGRFQQLCGNSFFNSKSSDKTSNDRLSDQSKMNFTWTRYVLFPLHNAVTTKTHGCKSEFEPRKDSPMVLDPNIHAFDGSMSANSSVPSQPLPWVSQGHDFNLFSSGTGLTLMFPEQPIPRLSPKSSFKKGDLLPHRDTDSGEEIDSKYPNHINPAQFFNNMIPSYDGMDESLDSGIDLPPVTQVSHSHGAINTVSSHAIVTGTKTVPHRGLEH